MGDIGKTLLAWSIGGISVIAFILVIKAATKNLPDGGPAGAVKTAVQSV